MAALNVSALLNALASSHGDKMVREAVGTWLGAAPAKVKKASKGKKESVRMAGATIRASTAPAGRTADTSTTRDA